MALPARKQLKYWGLAAVLFAVIMWALGNVLMPFMPLHGVEARTIFGRLTLR